MEAPYNVVIHHPKCEEREGGPSADCPCSPLHLEAETPIEMHDLLVRVATGIMEVLPGMMDRMIQHPPDVTQSW